MRQTQLTERLDRLPPIFCRGLAKHNGRLVSDAELCRRTGWTVQKLRSVYESLSWGQIAVCDVDTFMDACGLSWSSTRRQRWLWELAVRRGGYHTMRHMKAARSEIRSAYMSKLANLLT